MIKKFCLCCGKEIQMGLFMLSSCMDCIKAKCSGTGLYTKDGSKRWCNVLEKESCEIKQNEGVSGSQG